MIFILSGFLIFVFSSQRFNQNLERSLSAMSYLFTGTETSGASFGDRFHKNIIGLELFSEFPLSGHGMYAEEQYLKIVAYDGWYHNTHLEFLSGLGFFGFLTYVILILFTFFNICKFRSQLDLPYLQISFINILIVFSFLSVSSDPLLWGFYIPIVLACCSVKRFRTIK